MGPHGAQPMGREDTSAAVKVGVEAVKLLIASDREGQPQPAHK